MDVDHGSGPIGGHGLVGAVTQVKEKCPELLALLKEFDQELNGAPSEPSPFTDLTWLAHTELVFVLRSHRSEAFRALRRILAGGPSTNDPEATPHARNEALEAVDKLLQAVEEAAAARIAAVPHLKGWPLVLQLAQRYGLTPAESDLFQLLFMRGASRSAAVKMALAAKADEREQAMEVCNMSVLDVEEFLDDKRTHIIEGVIIEAVDDYEGKMMRMASEAVSALLRRPLKAEQRLKLSKTELLSVMESSETDEGGHRERPLQPPAAAAAPRAPKRKRADQDDEAEAKSDGHDLSEGIDDADLAGQLRQLEEEMRQGAGREVVPTSPGGPEVSPENEEGKGGEGPDRPAAEGLANGLANGASSMMTLAEEGEVMAYRSSLEYLDDAFQVLALLLRIAKARHKEDMKEACNEERPWYDTFRPTKVSSIRELRAKLRYVQNRQQERLRRTEEGQAQGLAELPRLEALARKLGLDEFEKGVVVMLAGVAISPVVKSIFEADSGDTAFRRSSDTVQVKDILTVYYDSFKEQVLARPYFYKSSKLASRGVIKMRPAPFTRSGGDLMDQQLELDRRMLDWIVGLDTEMNELVEGSHLYTPKISMEQVVLPSEQKSLLLRTVDNFGLFRQYRHKAGLEDALSYGAGLVILLCGASGTGKTMTVNALANHLGKRVLLVDFHSLYSGGSGGRGEDQSSDLRGLFRDAEMNDAIIFFDECEAIFAQREKGGDRVLNALLSEMERHEGIVMLATNRPLDLDEAMHRRITCVSEFRPPDHTQRKDIWQVASQKLPVAPDIAWDQLALRYELTGGYIKNALVSALLLAISRDSSHPEVTEEDVVTGCSLQMRGSLQMKSFTHRVVPTTGLEELVLTSSMRERLQSIVGFEKARGVLLGQWGFQQERLGAACLFWGPQGTGKSAVAEAIGFELGRPLKVVSCAQLLSRDSSPKTGSNISATFKDARLMDALLVLEDFQVMSAEEAMPGEGGVGSVSQWSPVALGLLLHELEKFPGTCILIANVTQSSIVRRLDPELLRRLKFLVEFKLPDQTARTSMWRKMLPAKVPLAPGVNFEELGKRFDFSSGAISSATVRAAAKAALRPPGKDIVTQKDLIEAADLERNHLKDEIDEIVMRAFI